MPRKIGFRIPDSRLKCCCGRCKICRSREYQRRHAAGVQADPRNIEAPEAPPAIHAPNLYGRKWARRASGELVTVNWRNGRNQWDAATSAARLDAFFARRAAYWRERIAAILSA